MSASIELSHVNFSYGMRHDSALNDVSFSVAPGSITGLFGRNGSGKSTLAMLIAGQAHASAGEILIDGTPVFENPELMANVCNAADAMAIFGDEKIKNTLKLWRDVRPNWDEEFAGRLFDTFQLSTKKKPDNLSRGQRSALHAILGLASRCPVTIFDEVHLGMDAVAREVFYRTVLADYTQNPRTIIMSSHLIDEIEDLLDHVLFVHEGRIIEHGEADEVRERHAGAGKLPSLTDVLVEMTIGDQS
ncbi:MAG: ATP-binding cassette domain-containing protein [Ancrocorticia sp.]|uniref:ATP-binding cassette domain-containing protein n=1 Tax=Ancrocorticia sp. TaxID=2593684 RepID=UPI003F92EB7A